jgi:hypothetical protein
MSDLKTLIINFKVIGLLQKDDKLCVKKDAKYLFIDPCTFYQPILRGLWYHDNRSFTYEKISSMMKDLHTLLDKDDSYKNLKLESYEKMKEYLYPILNDALNGLKTLKDTYSIDKTFSSQLEVEIANLEMIVKSVSPTVSSTVSQPVSPPIPLQPLQPLQFQQPLQMSPQMIQNTGSLPNSIQGSLNLNDNWVSDNDT